MNKRELISGQIYHICNRGVDKRKIFLDDIDYLRFIHDLFEFNDEAPILNLGHFFKQNPLIDSANQYVNQYVKTKHSKGSRKLLVEILAFCLMPNHYHLLLKQKKGGGITKFMSKLGIGYVNYFNQKYERGGVLFQGRFKSVLINQEAHFIHLPYYIHLNPLDLIEPKWKEKEIKDYKRSIKFLESYRWSSYLDYIGKKNFPSVTSREFLNQFFSGPEEYRKETIKWLREIELKELQTKLLE
jgi:putative transposase